MYNASKNPTVEYSLKALTESLFHLLQEKPLAEISIAELCRHAGISRKTFYRNCEEKEDLIRFATDYLLSELLKTVDFSSRDAVALYNNFFSFWYGHKEFLTAACRSGLFPFFIQQLIARCNETMRYPMQEEAVLTAEKKEEARNFANSFVLGGLGHMLYAWAAGNFSASPQELTNSILYLIPEV